MMCILSLVSCGAVSIVEGTRQEVLNVPRAEEQGDFFGSADIGNSHIHHGRLEISNASLIVSRGQGERGAQVEVL